MLIQPRINYKLNFSDYLTLFTSYSNSESHDITLRNLFEGYDILFFDKARNGLRFILENIGIQQARVGIQPLTCPTVLEAIYLSNCIPVFIDIADNYVIAPETIEKKLNAIDVLIVTHTFGISADIINIKKIMKDKIIIEDCAHALFSVDERGKIAGSLADFSLFSFGFGKFPAAVSGGFICIKKNISESYNTKYNTNFVAPSYKYLFRNLIQSIFLPILNSNPIFTLFTLKIKKQNERKNNYRLPSKQALKITNLKPNKILFIKKLQRIERDFQRQKDNGENLLNAIQKNNQIMVCTRLAGTNFFMLPLQIRNSDYFIQKCFENGIEIGKHFVKTYKILNYYGYRDGECSNYEHLIRNLVTLPTHYNYPRKKNKLLASIIANYKSELSK